jgi:superfamily I DNA/RNA helicase
MIKKIFGPPGTGKTTTLLNLVDEYIKKGTPLNRIGYFAFTRKAANEAKDRMLERNPELDKKDLRYFQTLHSFAFHTLGMSEENVMQPVHYEQIGKELNLRVTEVGDESGYLNFNSDYFKLINKARVKNISVEEEFNTNEWR